MTGQGLLSLERLGVQPQHELVYRGLLRVPGVTVGDLAQALGLDLAAVANAVLELERVGFATRSPETEPRLFPVPPDIAVESLLVSHLQALQQARRLIPDLQRESANGGETAQALIEIVSAEPAAQLQPYLQVHRGAKHEVICFMRPPFLISTPDTIESARAQARARGVRYRNIVHPDTLLLPGWPQAIRRVMETGEEVRVLDRFPFKMNVADRDYGLLPLRIDEPGGPVLLLRRSAVLDALCELFETLWEQAAPVTFGATGEMLVGGLGGGFSTDLDSLVALLAVGMNDKAIAHQLGISERTLLRRMERLTRGLHARTRFHAGWLAGQRLSAVRVTDVS